MSTGKTAELQRQATYRQHTPYERLTKNTTSGTRGYESGQHIRHQFIQQVNRH